MRSLHSSGALRRQYIVFHLPTLSPPLFVFNTFSCSTPHLRPSRGEKPEDPRWKRLTGRSKSTSDHHSAVGADHLTRDIGRALSRQKEYRSRHFLRSAMRARNPLRRQDFVSSSSPRFISVSMTPEPRNLPGMPERPSLCRGFRKADESGFRRGIMNFAGSAGDSPHR